MAATLTKLKGIIHTYSDYASTDISNPAIEELKKIADETVQMLFWDIEEQYNHYSTDVEKTTYIVTVQSQLSYLADGITSFEKNGLSELKLHESLKYILFRIFALLEHLRTYFPANFNIESDLPIHFTDLFKSSYSVFDSELKRKLEDNKVDPDLSFLIISFSEATSRSERFKIRTWRQWEYLLNTTQYISAFLDNPPSADINLEILKLFIRQEFNAIQVYGYFIKYLERTTLSEASFPEQQQELLLLFKTLRQVRVETKGYYCSNVPSLKESMIESLEAELTYLEQKEKVFLQNFKATNPEAPSKFYFKVAFTLAELMFFFRIALEIGLFVTKFNSYLYEFISNHIRTERAENISKKSMRNHFNNKPFPDRTVFSVRSWMEKMINHIDLYYKL